ncbi:MAG TPA: hypothetical protein VML75_19455, partial [Kofleriaceae bacterium]|nr:hypothetical protein [Kofleriaceae bacterium]
MRRGPRAAIAALGVVVSLALTAAPAPAQPGAESVLRDGQARFERAGDLRAAGELADAATAYVALADELPGDALADDA